MKTRIILIALTLASLSTQSVSAQSPVFDWVKQIEGYLPVQGASIALDTAGNVYTAGIFQGTADFDPGSETYNLSSAGASDIYIQKLDSSGNFVWAKRIGGSQYERSPSIAIDASGNVYTTGSFSGTVDFDPGPDSTTLTSAGDVDIFIQKLDTDGNFIWAKRMGGSQYDEGSSIAVDAYGNIYSTGIFMGTVDFDPGPGTANLISKGGSDIYVQKLDTDGNLIWAKSMGGVNFDYGKAIAVDSFGNVYTTGNYEGLADFDPGSETFQLTPIGGTDIFVQKLDPDGNFLWAKRMGGGQYDYGNAIAVDAAGNVFSAGSFESLADFDPAPVTYYLTSAGGQDVYVQKLDTDGNFLWAKRMGGISLDDGRSISLDKFGNVYTLGNFSETADFDAGPGTFNLTAGNLMDIFIQKLDPDGNFLWAKQMEASYESYGSSIAVDVHLNIYTTGFFSETTDFDPGQGTAILTSTNNFDTYVQKLAPCYPTMGPSPNVTDLAILTPICELTALDAPAPKASDDCDGTISASADQSFPITDQSITEIVWTYDDGAGNVFTQTQAITWTDMDVTTTLDWLTITANNPNGTYQWLNCDNNNSQLAYQTNQSFTASANGSYAVRIKEEGCVDTSECVSIISVGLDEFDQEVKVAVYPNPSSDIFNIAFEKPVAHAVLTITDMQGKLVSTTTIKDTTKASIELNEAHGIYLLTIKSKYGQKTIQLVVSP